MIKTLLTITTIVLCCTVFSQESVTITGKIVDVETNEALSFATINIKNSPKGVVANEEGEFEFTFSSEYLKDTIVFSYAGYQTEEALAQAIYTRETTIQLVKKSVMLAEVVVTNKELTAWQIIELALLNIKENYPTKPFELKAFYRDYKIENEKCVSIFEAAISAYDKGYSKVLAEYAFKEKVVLEQVRKSLAVDYQTHAFKRINIIKEILRLNDVRYQSRALRKKNHERYSYDLAGYEVINNRLMYKIKAVEDWSYFIYVDVVSYAIPKIEMQFNWEKDVAENSWSLFDSIRYNQTKATMQMDFQMIDGRYYPRYCSFTTNLDAFDYTTNEPLFSSYLKQEYMVTDIDFNPDEKPKKQVRMNPEEMIENQTANYDAEFWENYNVLKLHPRDAELIKGLEEKMKIEEQFAKDNQ